MTRRHVLLCHLASSHSFVPREVMHVTPLRATTAAAPSELEHTDTKSDVVKEEHAMPNLGTGEILEVCLELEMVFYGRRAGGYFMRCQACYPSYRVWPASSRSAQRYSKNRLTLILYGFFS